MKTELEDNGDNEGFSSRFMLIGKVIARKILYRKIVLNILRNIWSIEVAFMIKEVEENIYIVSVL